MDIDPNGDNDKGTTQGPIGQVKYSFQEYARKEETYTETTITCGFADRRRMPKK